MQACSDWLRPVALQDLPMVLAWRNHPSVRQFMLRNDLITENQHEKWFESLQNNSMHEAFIYEKNAEPCGFVQFKKHDADEAEWGFYVAPEQRKGTGRELGQCALNYAFQTIRLRKVIGKALTENIKSIHFHESLGFRRESDIQHSDAGAGEKYSLICFGLLSDTWKSLSDSNGTRA